jgi:hypothetical protein
MGASAYLRSGWQRLREARGQLFDLSYDLKWAIMGAVLASVVLAAPSQVIELYRILHSEGRPGDMAVLIVAVAAMGTAFWTAAWISAADAVSRMDAPLPLTLTVSRLAPAVLGALPLLGCAAGHFAARPNQLPAKVAKDLARAGSPWVGIAEELGKDLGTKLPAFGLLFAFLAIALLGVALWRRRRPHRRGLIRLGEEGARPRALLASLGLVALLCAAFTASPVTLPRALGTFGIVALFFVTLAMITTQLSLMSIRYRAPIIPALLGLAVAASVLNLNDNHAVRRIAADQPRQQPRPVGAEFDDWYRARPDLDRYKGEYPVYLVAAQGGGIYAAYQAAAVLARLQDSCPAFRHHLFAISSVSGGSVGAAMFASALAENPEPLPAEEAGCDKLMTPSESPGPIEQRVTAALKSDHLSPLVAATLFPDFTQRFLPFPIGGLDRARALEYSFEQSAREAGIDRFADRFRQHWWTSRSSPALVINSTDAATGARYLIAPFRLTEQHIPAATAGGGQAESALAHFPFEGDERDLRMSTATVISARFPWLTPAALLPARAGRPARRLVDGGYVDNSGLETALDLYEELRGREIVPVAASAEGVQGRPRPRFIIIAITGGGLLKRSSYALGETLEPIRALLSTRVSRSFVALERAYRQMPSEPLRLLPMTPLYRSQVRTVGLSNRYYDLPLGWRLSERSRRIIGLQSGRGWDCEPGRHFEQTAPELAAADCVQALVSAEMNQTMDRFAWETAAMNYRDTATGRAARPRFDHEAVLRCYGQSAGERLTYRQNRQAVNFMLLWDGRSDLQDERWLAFALGALVVDTAGFTTVRGRGTPEEFEKRAGPDTPLGRRLGNVERGDAWRYRPRGALYAEGRGFYRRVGQAIGFPQLEQMPDLAFNPEISARYFFHNLFDQSRGRMRRFFNGSTSDWVNAGLIVWGPHSSMRKYAQKAAAEGRRFHACLRASKARA